MDRAVLVSIMIIFVIWYFVSGFVFPHVRNLNPKIFDTYFIVSSVVFWFKFV